MLTLLADRPILYGGILTALGVLGLLVPMGLRGLLISGTCLLLGLGGIVYGIYDAIAWKRHWGRIDRERAEQERAKEQKMKG